MAPEEQLYNTLKLLAVLNCSHPSQVFCIHRNQGSVMSRRTQPPRMTSVSKAKLPLSDSVPDWAVRKDSGNPNPPHTWDEIDQQIADYFGYGN